jgi:hypothetical protein
MCTPFVPIPSAFLVVWHWCSGIDRENQKKEDGLIIVNHGSYQGRFHLQGMAGSAAQLPFAGRPWLADPVLHETLI